MSLNRISLKLFNAVLEESKKTNSTPVFLEKEGVVINSNAVYAKTEILEHIRSLTLSNESLNKAFYASFEEIEKMTDVELFIDQILHYASTYGTNFQGEEYLPEKELNLPKDVKVKLYFIAGLTRSEMNEKAMDMLRSGIALKEETLKLVLELLELNGYVFEDVDQIRNNEALAIIASKHRVFPKDPVSLLRVLIYKATGSSLMIKDKSTCEALQSSNIDVSEAFEKAGLENVASVFNRFKPLMLALKKANKNNVSVINKIAKLSKKHHKPMVQNPLNLVTSMKVEKQDMHWVSNATVFMLLRAMNVCYKRLMGQEHFFYRVRNGKSWANLNENKENKLDVCLHNYEIIKNELKTRLDGKGRTVFIPQNIEYGLPTSEKTMIGNVPVNTKVLGSNLSCGIYWENSWGASDLDLSGISIQGKTGWDSAYRGRGLAFSGDRTDASNGACEYFTPSGDNFSPTLMNVNVFSGSENSEFNVIVGEKADPSYKYMMNQDNLIFTTKVQANSRQSIVGLFYKNDEGNHVYVLMNSGSGSRITSSKTDLTMKQNDALFDEIEKSITFNHFLQEIGFNVIRDKSELKDDQVIDIDLSVQSLTKSTFIDLLKEEKEELKEEKAEEAISF